MGLTLNQKEEIRRKVAEGAQPKPSVPEIAPAAIPAAVYPSISDDLIIEITGNSSTYSFSLRPHEVSRLRGRYGRGPQFEKWVGERIRDAMISFGGG